MKILHLFGLSLWRFSLAPFHLLLYIMCNSDAIQKQVVEVQGKIEKKKILTHVRKNIINACRKTDVYNVQTSNLASLPFDFFFSAAFDNIIYIELYIVFMCVFSSALR